MTVTVQIVSGGSFSEGRRPEHSEARLVRLSLYFLKSLAICRVIMAYAKTVIQIETRVGDSPLISLRGENWNLLPDSEPYSELSQTSKIELFAIIHAFSR